ATLGRRATAHRQAASDWSGRARLVRPPAQTSDHACYIEADPDGPIEVVRLDDLSLPTADLERVVLKLDVEGEELPALRGATHLITAAKSIAVAFEAHPEVAARTGVDPIECLRFLETLRSWRVVVSELPQARVDSRRPLFEQIPSQIVNVVCTSGDDAT
ncbi:MAG TPA: FkbM family methyltransferase, partial [Pirellulales bacterium]